MATKTMEQWAAENNEQALRIAELEAQVAANVRALTIKMSDFSSGSISLYGLRRQPLSFYPGELPVLYAILPRMMKYAEEHPDEVRAAAYATEYVKKSGIKWDQSQRGEDGNAPYKRAYADAYTSAMKDKSLVSSVATKVRTIPTVVNTK